MVLRSTKLNNQSQKTKELTPFRASVVKAGKVLESFIVDARHQHEAWSLACLKYMEDNPGIDLDNVDILITLVEVN